MIFEVGMKYRAFKGSTVFTITKINKITISIEWYVTHVRRFINANIHKNILIKQFENNRYTVIYTPRNQIKLYERILS